MEVKGFDTLGFDKIYVLNLPHRKDRRQKIRQTLDFNGITKYEFLKNTVDGRDLSFDWLLEENIMSPIQIDHLGISAIGTFGCALSHYNAWIELANSEYDNAVFFEDDIYESKSLDKLYNIIQIELPLIKDWDILFLGRMSDKNYGTLVTDNIIKPETVWICPEPKPWGTHSYVLTKKAAQFLVNDYLPIWTAVDIYLDSFILSKKLNVYHTLDNWFHQYNQWIQYQQNIIIEKALQQSSVGLYNDSDIISNKPGKFGVSEFKNFIKHNDSVVSINSDGKTVTFFTEESFNNFLKDSKTIDDLYKLFGDTDSRGLKKIKPKTLETKQAIISFEENK